MSAAVPFPPAAGGVGEETLGPQITVASWVLTSMSAAFLFLRFTAKLWTGRRLLVDDYLLLGAWLAILVSAITSTAAVRDGLGRHVFAVPLEDIPSVASLINITVTILIVAAALSKTSFAITVLRLVTGPMRMITWFIMVSTNVFLGINIILLWASFKTAPGTAPPSSADLALEEALAGYGIAVTAYSAAMDFALVAIAWSIVLQLKMRSTREKVGLGVAMSMGLAAGATSLVKAAVLPSLAGGDVTYAAASLHVWSLAEPAVTIMAASIPLLRVLYWHAWRITTATDGPAAPPGSFFSAGRSKASLARSLGGSVRRMATAGGSLYAPARGAGDKSFMLASVQEMGRTGTSDGRPREAAGRDRTTSAPRAPPTNAGYGPGPLEPNYTQYAHTGERLTAMVPPAPYEVVDVTQYGRGGRQPGHLTGQPF